MIYISSPISTSTVESGYIAIAFVAFFKQLYNRTQLDDLGNLLSDIGYLPDGKPADPAVWGEWLECVSKAKQGKIDLDLRIGNID